MAFTYKINPTKWDAAFDEFKREHPNATFAEYGAYCVAKGLTKGEGHRTLGAKIMEPGEGGEDHEVPFAEAGRRRFKAYSTMMGLEPHHRLVDYGCGSLRIGYHVMNYLDPGNYFGLDVTTDFIDIGKELIGPSLTERRPHLGAITPENLAEAKAFGTDFVFSCAVALHVHPDETATYYGNLQSLAWKPGSGVFVSVRLSDEPKRFAPLGWSWPLDFYIKSLPELRFEGQFAGGMMKFVRPA